MFGWKEEISWREFEGPHPQMVIASQKPISCRMCGCEENPEISMIRSPAFFLNAIAIPKFQHKKQKCFNKLIKSQNSNSKIIPH
jgi:hypothetical protein